MVFFLREEAFMMKKFKENKKKFIILFIIIGVTASSVNFLNADTDKWEGWNDDTKHDAWTVYRITDWAEMGGLDFGADANAVVSADVGSYFEYQYEPLVRDALKDKSARSGLHGQESYIKLMLCILYEIKETPVVERNGNVYASPDMNTVLNDENWYKWICEEGDSECTWESVQNIDKLSEKQIREKQKGHKYSEIQKKSVLYIYNKLINAESEYFNKYESAEIFQSDNCLGSIIQSTLYGNDFLKKNREYSPKKASKFYDENDAVKDLVTNRSYDNFAYNVLQKYHSAPIASHSVIG